MLSPDHFFSLVRFSPNKESIQSNYYWNLYKKFHKNFIVPKINWAGFAFGSTLFLYRRMYFTFLIMLVVEQAIEAYVYQLGFDRGMAHAYGSFLGNVLTALIFNSVYLFLVKRKAKNRKTWGVHLRLFYPAVTFMAMFFSTLLFQFIGLHWNIGWINFLTNYLLLGALIYTFILYIYYFFNWKFKRSNV